jgi:D-threo-aldose 1-dehydrogenase
VFDYGYESVMRSHEESLERLGVPRVDILLCHDIGRLTHGAAHETRLREFLDGGYRAMRELRQSGAVRAIGIGVNEWEVCDELLAHCEFDCIMLAGRYTLLEQHSLPTLLSKCVSRGVSIICAGPFNSGILAAGSRGATRSHYNYAPPPPEVIERVRQLEAMCDEFSVPLQAAALQFPLAHPSVATVVAGCSSGGEARRIAEMFTHEIPAGFWRALRERNLVDARAPLPA